MSTEIALFKSEASLSQFTKKKGMKFARAIMCDEPGAKDQVKAERREGRAVVRLENYALGKDAYLVFHK